MYNIPAYNMMPEAFRTAMYEQSRRALDTQQKMIDWQLDQVKRMEKQSLQAMEANMALFNASVSFWSHVQKDMVEALAPSK